MSEACEKTSQGCNTAWWQLIKDLRGLLGSCRDLAFQHLAFGMEPHLVTLLKLISSIWTPRLVCAPPLSTLPRLQGVTGGTLPTPQPLPPSNHNALENALSDDSLVKALLFAEDGLITDFLHSILVDPSFYSFGSSGCSVRLSVNVTTRYNFQ